MSTECINNVKHCQESSLKLTFGGKDNNESK